MTTIKQPHIYKLMKKTIIPLLAIMVLAGCTKDDGNSGNTPTAGDLVPISLSTTSATTKAPVNTGDAFTAAIAGWESDGTPERQLLK